MFKELSKKIKAAVPQKAHGNSSSKKGFTNLAKKTKRLIIEQNAVAAVPESVGGKKGELLKSSAPNITQPLNNSSDKKKESKSTLATQCNKIKTACTLMKKEENGNKTRILEKMQKESLFFSNDVIRGTTGNGALLYRSTSASSTQKSCSNQIHSSMGPYSPDYIELVTNYSNYLKYKQLAPLSYPMYGTLNHTFMDSKTEVNRLIELQIEKKVHKIAGNSNITLTYGDYKFLYCDGFLSDFTFEQKVKIIIKLKNKEKLTGNYLVDLGVEKPKKHSGLRGLFEHNPDNDAAVIEKEYNLLQLNTSFTELEVEHQEMHQAELEGIMYCMAADVALSSLKNQNNVPEPEFKGFNFENSSFVKEETGVSVRGAEVVAEEAGATVNGVIEGTGQAKYPVETETFLPDEFYNKNLPKHTTPGTKMLPKYDEYGNLKQIKYFDDYGRETGWVDFSNHGYPSGHTTPHWHEVKWNAQYPIGGYKIDHRMDPNPPFNYFNDVISFER